MSTRIMINVAYQSENLLIDTYGANEKLMEECAELASLYADVSKYKWFNGILEFANRRLRIADPEGDSYTAHVEAYYCWDMEVMQTIADHITQGKLVLSENSEDLGEDTVYYILTPGNVETYRPRFE